MPNPTHPPTQLGNDSQTRLVPEEFGGSGPGAGTATATATQSPDKPGSGSRISRRKLILGVGGVAGLAVVGGGAAFALSGKDSSTNGTDNAGNRSPVGANNAAATGTAATSPTDSGTSSASGTDSPTGSDTSDTAAGDAATSTSSASGAPQPSLSPSGSPVGHIEIAGQPSMSMSYVGGGKYLVVADDKNGVQLFDVSNAAGPQQVSTIAVPLSNGQIQALNKIDYSPKRNLLALGGAGGLALWDVTDPTKPVQLSARGDVNGNKVNSVAFNSDGSKLVVATDADYYANNPNGSCVMDVSDAHNPVQWSGLTPASRDILTAARFAHSDKYIVSSGSGEDSSTALFQLWDSSDPHNVRPVDSTAWWGQGDNATKLSWALAVAGGGPWNTLVVGLVSADTNVQDLQFLDFRNPLTPVKQASVQNTSGAVVFHPTRPIVAVGEALSGATTLYDMTDPNHPTYVSRLDADPGHVAQLAFSPDGSTLAVAVKKSAYNSNSMVYFWKM